MVEIGYGGRGTHAVLKQPSKPNLKSFDLTNISIREIENACIVECRYKMKASVEEKLKSQSKEKYVDYDLKNTSEEHSFPTREEAAQFITARLLGKDYKTPEKVDAAPKTKVTTRA